MKTIEYNDGIIIQEVKIIIPDGIADMDPYAQIEFVIKAAQNIKQCPEWCAISVTAEICGEYAGIVSVTGDSDAWYVWEDLEHRVLYHSGWSLDN